jgi:hypothetical protein
MGKTIFDDVVSDDDLAQYKQEPPDEGNPLTNLAKGLYKGTVYGLPQQVAKASQFLGIGGETAKAVSDWAEEGLGGKDRQPGMFEQAGEMIPESAGVSMVLMGAGKLMSLIPHPIFQGAGYATQAAVLGANMARVGGLSKAATVAGKYVTPWLFGAAQAQSTKET